jgi:hypothetical protein
LIMVENNTFEHPVATVDRRRRRGLGRPGADDTRSAGLFVDCQLRIASGNVAPACCAEGTSTRITDCTLPKS